MATMLGSLLISLGLDSGQFRSGMSAADKEVVKFQRSMNKTAQALQDLGAKMTLGITAPLAAFGGFAVKASSDAAELQSAFDQTFGALSKQMTAWADTTGDAMGRSTQEIQQAANTFGIFFNQAAPTKQAAAELSKEFAVLAQDLSSFFNVDPTEAMQKLRSGLAGESEPLRDFGVFLNEAAVQAKAFEMGIATVGAKLTEQQKIMARSALIMEATVVAQGDVARTADGTANRIREAKAAFEELQVAIGDKLIPAVRPLIEGLTRLVNGFANLSPTMQTALVIVGGVAAAAGPLIFIIGGLKGALVALGGAIVAAGGTGAALKIATASMIGMGPAAASAAAGVTGLGGALLRLSSAILPLTLALTAVGVVVAIFTTRSAEARAEAERLGAVADANAKQFLGLEDAAEKAGKELGDLSASKIAAQAAAAGLTIDTKKLADAHYLAAAGALAHRIQEQKLAVALGAKKVRALAQDMKRPNRVSGPGDANQRATVTQRAATALGGWTKESAAEFLASEEYKNYQRDKRTLAAMQNEPIVPLVPDSGGADPVAGEPTKPGPKPKTPKSDARDPADIAADFADEQVRLEMEALQAKQRLATGSEERAELQYDMLEIERAQRLAEIEASDFSAQQKDALRAQVEELHGVAASVDEQGVIVANANRGLIARQIEQDRTYELEQRLADAMQSQFELRRDHLQLDLEMADTQAERKRLALEILALEQAYRRNQLEMVLASEISTQAEKDRAQAILASLGLLERKEAAAAAKANRTEVESYRDYVNMSAGQINEAVDGIKIAGLEALNQGLVDAMTGVKSLGEVFKNVANQIISDLLRIAIRKAIIAPLADALFGGGGPLNLLSGTPFDGIDGARAMGGPVLAGGTYLVGERGPELFRPQSSGSIVPNHKLGQLGSGAGGGGELSIRLGPGLEAEWLRKSAGQAVQIVQAVAPGMLSTASSKARRDAARPVMPGGATG